MWMPFLRYVRPVFRIIFFLQSQIFAYLPYCVWMTLLSPIALVNPILFYAIEGKLGKIATVLGSAAGWTAGYTYYEVGDDVTSCLDEECLFIGNHLSFVDGQTFMAIFSKKIFSEDVIERNMFLVDSNSRFTHYGLASWFHGHYFVKKGALGTEQVRLKKHLCYAFSRRNFKSITLFPEGAFLCYNQPSSDRYARKNNLPKLENVCWPRVGAFLVIIDALHPGNLLDLKLHKGFAMHKSYDVRPLKWVIDITFSYQKGEPVKWMSMILMNENPSKIFLHYRRFPIEMVPIDREATIAWLNDRFVEKEHILKDFYKTMSISNGPTTTSRFYKNPKEIKFSMKWLVMVNIYCILSTLLHYKLVSYLLSFLWDKDTAPQST